MARGNEASREHKRKQAGKEHNGKNGTERWQQASAQG